MAEQWRRVGETPYEVSDYGNVRGPLGMMHPTPSTAGYPRVHLRRANRRMEYVHRLVLEVFIGPCPDGMQVNHKNAVKSDNRLANLEYVTPGGNTLHAWASGLMPRVRKRKEFCDKHGCKREQRVGKYVRCAKCHAEHARNWNRRKS